MNLDIKLHKQDLPDEIKFSDKIAIDCEFTGLNIERDRLCLLQISSGENDAHIIQLNKDNYDAPNLKKILDDENIIKLFHFARADLLFIKKYLEVDVKNVHCTKVMSKIARSYSDKHGLKDLVKEILDIELDKNEQTSDWSRKKLTKLQIKYALNDILYLSDLKINLFSKLDELKRLKTFNSLMKLLKIRVELDLMGWENTDIFAHK